MTESSPFLLETRRLILRDLLECDIPLIYALSREPLVTRYQTWFRLKAKREVQRFLGTLRESNLRRPRVSFNVAIVLKENESAIGWLGFGDDRPPKVDVGFGYALLPSVWGNGYMTEAVQAMLEFVFSYLAAESVHAHCAESNRASARVLERTGLVLVERRQQRDDDLGIVEEHLHYRLKRSEWARSRQTTII
jgi:ribosomal-protein-alanine N-acetyltransferase